MKLRRVQILALALMLVIPMLLSQSHAVQYSDTTGHWAEAAVERWSELGVLKGSNGLFRPNDKVTRAELAAIMNRILDFPAESTCPYTDVLPGSWYYEDVKALARQEIFPTLAGTLKPDEHLTRQEAIVIIGRACVLDYAYDKYNTLTFTDQKEIPDEARFYALRMAELGFINGRPDSSFGPTDSLTRAEVVTILNNMFNTVINQPGEYSGDLGPNVLVTCSDVTLRAEPSPKVVFLGPRVAEKSITVMIQPRFSWTLYSYYSGSGSGSHILNDASNIGWLARAPRRPLRYVTDLRFPGGDGSESDPYRIKTQSDLERLRDYVDSVAGYLVFFRLENDIALEGVWTPIGSDNSPKGEEPSFFCSTLDGNGHTISGLNVNTSGVEYVSGGLFGSLAGSVRNLRIEGSIHLDGGRFQYGGALAGFVSFISNDSTGIEYLPLRMTVENCHANVTVTAVGGAISRVGGLLGLVNGDIYLSACSSAGSIDVSALVAKQEDGNATAGGLVGDMHKGKNLDNCHSTADVRATGGFQASAGGLIGSSKGFSASHPTMITGCYASGNVSASGGGFQNNAGGLTGQVIDSQVMQCWASGDVEVGQSGDGCINVSGGLCSGIYDGASAENCYAVGNVTVNGSWIDMSGSLTGRLEGQVKNCYAAGRVKFSRGTGYDILVASRRGAGGTIINSFNLASSAMCYMDEPSGSIGTSSITEAQAAQKATYANRDWDFDTIWAMPASGSYPYPILQQCSSDIQQSLKIN